MDSHNSSSNHVVHQHTEIAKCRRYFIKSSKILDTLHI